MTALKSSILEEQEGWSNQAIWWKRKELQAEREVLRLETHSTGRSDHVLGTARSDTVPVPGEHVGKYQLLNTRQSDYVSELMSCQFCTRGGINRGLSCCTKEFDSYFEDTRKPLHVLSTGWHGQILAFIEDHSCCSMRKRKTRGSEMGWQACK